MVVSARLWHTERRWRSHYRAVGAGADIASPPPPIFTGIEAKAAPSKALDENLSLLHRILRPSDDPALLIMVLAFQRIA